MKMPIFNTEQKICNGVYVSSYPWVGEFYAEANTYSQYRHNWEARKRFLDLEKHEKSGRVKKEAVEGGYIYDDFKIKSQFFIDNTLVREWRDIWGERGRNR
jgi:hypothetical protein